MKINIVEREELEDLCEEGSDSSQGIGILL